MSELKIQCPKCSNEIELTEQLAGPMLADLRASFNDELAKRETQATEALAAARAQAKEAATAETSAEQAALQDRIKAQDEKLKVAQAAQTASRAVFCGKANARRTGQPVGLPSCAMIKGRRDVRLLDE